MFFGCDESAVRASEAVPERSLLRKQFADSHKASAGIPIFCFMGLSFTL